MSESDLRERAKQLVAEYGANPHASLEELAYAAFREIDECSTARLAKLRERTSAICTEHRVHVDRAIAHFFGVFDV